MSVCIYIYIYAKDTHIHMRDIQKFYEKCIFFKNYTCISIFFHQSRFVLTHYNTSEQDVVWGTKKGKTSVWKDTISTT